ncbi:Lrp/AsnC family transcriptional regulator [Kitasatospora sp. NPDC008115]|uniref:Lrp/AsnC family transcriptional regulator n=1 Tax=Kitasatospora sp. NPDC008115 TaxID=3364022 RepID=UPI0036E8511B
MDVTAADPDTVLDTLDRRLVCALQVNGRAGAGRIAEVLGISARTVTRRLARLQRAGLVRVVRMPGTEDAAVGALLLRVRVLHGEADTVARALADRPDVPFVDVMLGGREIGAVVLGDAGAHDRLSDGRPPETASAAVVAETAVHAVLHAFPDAGQWRSGHLGEAEAAALAEPPAARPAPGSVPPDELDRVLLARLGEDARQSHAALAAAVGTPESTVRRRLNRLDGAGLVRTHVTVDPRLLGLAVDARLWLDVPPGRLAAVGAALARHPQVHGVFATSGPANLMAAVFCADHGGLYRFVTDTLGPLGVGRAETTIVARAVKREGAPLPGPRARA